VEAGSRQENASKQKSRAPFRFNRNGKGSGCEQKLQALNLLEDAMDISSVPTFLACGAFFVLSFATIAAFWFAERLRGANAPHL
jgi:hypothetical protein